MGSRVLGVNYTGESTKEAREELAPSLRSKRVRVVVEGRNEGVRILRIRRIPSSK